MDFVFTLHIKMLAQNPVLGGAEASIAFGTALPMTRDQPVNPQVRVRDFRVRVRVDCFIPEPVPISIPKNGQSGKGVDPF
jgi:hypothetical protein